MMRWAWSCSDREEESLLGRTRGSRSELRLVADWLTQLNPLSDTCVCTCVHVWEEEGEGEGRQRKRARARVKKRERELHGNSCSNTKWSLLAHYPSFVPFPSISLTQLISLLTHIFFLHLECLCTTNTLDIKWNYHVKNIDSDFIQIAGSC